MSKHTGDAAADYAYRYGSKLYSVTSTFPGEGTVTCDYAGDGKRRMRQVSGQSAQWFAYDSGWNVINEEDGPTSGASLTMMNVYSRAGGVAALLGSDAGSITGTVDFIYIHDGSRMLRAVINSECQPIGRYSYVIYEHPFEQTGRSLQRAISIGPGLGWEGVGTIYTHWDGNGSGVLVPGQPSPYPGDPGPIDWNGVGEDLRKLCWGVCSLACHTMASIVHMEIGVMGTIVEEICRGLDSYEARYRCYEGWDNWAAKLTPWRRQLYDWCDYKCWKLCGWLPPARRDNPPPLVSHPGLPPLPDPDSPLFELSKEDQERFQDALDRFMDNNEFIRDILTGDFFDRLWDKIFGD